MSEAKLARIEIEVRQGAVLLQACGLSRRGPVVIWPTSTHEAAE